jgi:chitodextrinase
VTLKYSGDGTVIGTTTAKQSGTWSLRKSNVSPVPCHVRAESGGSSATGTVSGAPLNCSDNGGGGGGDTTSPTAPSNLAATAAGMSQINLSWTASTDNVGVTGYRVERCQGGSCSNFAQIATPTGTTYNDTGLTANTTYRYRTRATDAAGNLSGYSNIASATTGQATACANPAKPNTSINSTSQDGCPQSTVPQQAQVPNTTYSVLAINDLGMHCGDLDTRIASILPPYNVLHAQVVQKGATPCSTPRA